MTAQFLGNDYKIEKVLHPAYLTKGISEDIDRRVLCNEFNRQFISLLKWYDEQSNFITKKYQAQRAKKDTPDSPDISLERLHISTPRAPVINVERKSVLPPLPDRNAAVNMTYLVAAALSMDNVTPFNINWDEVQSEALQNFEDQKHDLVFPIRMSDVTWTCTNVICKTFDSYLNKDRVIVVNRKMTKPEGKLYTLADLVNQLVVKNKAVAVVNAYKIGVVLCFYYHRTATNFDMIIYASVDPNAGNGQTCSQIHTPPDFVKIVMEYCYAALPGEHVGAREIPDKLNEFEFVLIEKFTNE